MQTENGIEIINIQSGSPAEKAGFCVGDRVFSVNSNKIRDPIDFMFNTAHEKLNIELKREGKKLTINIIPDDKKVSGIIFKQFKIMTCRNNCIFCFVKQLPKGLRKTLYIKDEDYRMSFMYGNYITMSNLSKKDRKRIIEQRLSPLYVSVHSTNRTLRNRLLGNPKAPDILKELKFLTDNKLRFNAQIVLCPGYNDGKELQQTLSSLYKFYPYLLSVAVVPVGLTSYRKHRIRPVEKDEAIQAIKIISSFQKRFIKKHGNPIVYGADELYLKAEIPFPPLKEYGELHQIENGVGMVSLFSSQAKKIKHHNVPKRKKKFLTFTGFSFYPYLKKFLSKYLEHLSIDVIPVENRFFGSYITVAGLLTGRDVIKTVLDKIEGHNIILVPDVVLNEENKFLDDITLHDIEETLGIPARKIHSTPEGLIKGITE